MKFLKALLAIFTFLAVALTGALEIQCGRCDDTPLLRGIHRSGRGIQRVFGAGLDLAEHQCPVRIPQDEVDLPHPGVIIVAEKLCPLLLVEAGRGGLSSLARLGPAHHLPSGQ